MKKKLVILKLGGSLITDKSKPYTPKVDVIHNLALQIKSALSTDRTLHLIIGNGGGSFPHYPAVTYNMQDGIKTKKQLMGYAKVQDAAARLNRIIVKQLIQVGIQAVSVQPSAMILCREGKVISFFSQPLIHFVELGLIPVFYGDIVSDTIYGSTILSTETIIVELANNLHSQGYPITKIIQNGLTQGVLDKNNNVIANISPNNIAIVKGAIQKTHGFDVTGGMWHKIEESIRLAKTGVPTVIINGAFDKNLLHKAILGQRIQGTYITA